MQVQLIAEEPHDYTSTACQHKGSTSPRGRGGGEGRGGAGGHLEAVGEGDRGLPAELLQDELIVRVAATHALGAGDVLDAELAVAEAKHELHHAVHGHHLRRPEVERLLEVALGDAQDALDAVVDERERPRLLAVPPHLHLTLHARPHPGVTTCHAAGARVAAYEAAA